VSLFRRITLIEVFINYFYYREHENCTNKLLFIKISKAFNAF